MKHITPTTRVLLSLIALFLFACATTDHCQTIAVGDTREKIIALLGNPSNPEKDLSSRERETINSALQKTNNRDSESFSIWKRDGDLF
jgi:type IV pilus biogenesis protein CpaD/CtpE